MLVATALVGSACHGLLRHAAFHASRRSKFGALLTPRFFKVSRAPSIYGSSPRCARATRRARFRAACRFGGGRPAPPYGWDTRAARATHHAPRARSAHHAHRRALHRAPRCTAHHAPRRATLRHAPPVCSSHSWARAAWGRCSQKNAGRPPIFSSCIRWRACLSSILHRAPRCAPRTTRHAAPRCATHHPCALAIVGPGPPGGRCSQKDAGRPPIFSSCIRWRACLSSILHHAPRCTAHAAPRCATPRHAAPRCATHAADVITLAGASPNDPGRLLVSVWV